MSDPNPQLVDTITRLVIQALQQRAVAASPNVAEIHPPAGLCPSGVESPKTSSNEAESAGLTLSGVVTANELAAAIQSVGHTQKVYLAASARLTPLAQDLAKAHANRIARLSARSLIQNGPGDLPTFLAWLQGPCPVTQTALKIRASQIRSLALPMGHEHLAESLSMIAQAIRGKRVVGGMLFVTHSPLALCLANRSRTLRAVVGTSVESLDHALASLSPNLLIVEYPRTSANSLSAMLDRWMAGVGQTSPSPWLKRQMEAMSKV